MKCLVDDSKDSWRIFKIILLVSLLMKYFLRLLWFIDFIVRFGVNFMDMLLVKFVLVLFSWNMCLGLFCLVVCYFYLDVG